MTSITFDEVQLSWCVHPRDPHDQQENRSHLQQVSARGVLSYEKGPRQRIVMTLTELELDRSLWPPLANAIAERLSGVTSLVESDPLIARYADLAFTKYSIRAKVATASEQRSANADLETVDLVPPLPPQVEASVQNWWETRSIKLWGSPTSSLMRV